MTATLSLSYPPPTLLIKCAGTIAIMAMAKTPHSTEGLVKPNTIGLESPSGVDGFPLNRSMTHCKIFDAEFEGIVHSYAIRPTIVEAMAPYHAGR